MSFQITDGEGIRYLPQHVIKDLSRDQHYLREVVNSIRTGIMSGIAKNYKIWPIFHSRWVILARRMGRL